MKKHQRALVWFTQDLRIHDNPALSQAHQHAEAVLHVCFIQDLLRLNKQNPFFPVSEQRKRFLFEGLDDLSINLKAHGHDLLIIDQASSEALPNILKKYQIDVVYCAKLHGFDEREDWATFQRAFEEVGFIACESYSLYAQQSLPFAIADLPRHFTEFRKSIERHQISIRNASSEIIWAKPIANHPLSFDLSEQLQKHLSTDFKGGETAAIHHLSSYFNTDAASFYKQTRNALMGFGLSTKFSPWLAQGSLSVVKVMQQLAQYEQLHGANDSTYWIYFELLWREYFYWLAILLGKRLFLKMGLREQSPKTRHDEARFQQWMNGQTDWPIINACMHELSATGYMSNRGRQLVASCLINELALDWRYGAAYFESQLIDYDVGANWGNWQYLAGVGVDPRGQRHFDLQKQTKMYDPVGAYMRFWHG